LSDYPFTTVAAERFGWSNKFQRPKVASTGSGGEFRSIIDGIGVVNPDIMHSLRAIRPSDLEVCAKNGVTEIIDA
jgi:phosphate transport system substrate-binding protein